MEQLNGIIMKTSAFYHFLTSTLLISLTATVLQLYAQNPNPCNTRDFGKNEHTGRYYNLRGISLYVEHYGKGQPLVLLHGNGGSIGSFSCQIPYFEKEYHVIAIDSRAQGKSADPSDTLSFDMMADDVSTLLDSLHLDSCYVIGWSDGGITGLLLAIRHPDKVKRLAITGANLKPDSSSLYPNDLNWMKQEYARLGNLSQTPETKNQRKLLGLDLLEPRIRAADLRQIHCPALVIGGDHDVIPPAHTLLIAQSIPRAFLWILPNSSHATLMDYHKKFNTTVDDFFRDKLSPN